MTKLFFLSLSNASTWKNFNVDGGGILGKKKSQKNLPNYIQVNNRLVIIN